MFKFVVILAFVAACSATYNIGQPKSYLIDVGKDYIKVANEYGKYVTFKVDKYYGYEAPQNIFVEYYGQYETPKVVEFFDRKAEGLYQSEILYKIFNEYSGQIDAAQYEKILDIVRKYVQNDQIYPTVLYALKALYGDEEALNYFYQESYQTPYSRYGYYGKGYGDYQQQTPYDKFNFYFGKNYGYGDYNRDYYNQDHQGFGSYYPHQYVSGKGIYDSYYGPYNNEYQYSKGHGLYQQTPSKNWGFLFGKIGFGYDNTYNREYGVGSYYPSKYDYTQEHYGPYNQQYSKQYGYGYPQNFYGQYPRYQYGKTYGVEYPQQYQGSYAQQYYGPYANQYSSYYRGYGDNLHYQKPYYF